MKQKPELTIQEIALIKTLPEGYLEILKTHDGTSMGGLRTTIQDFSQKYATDRNKHIASYDQQGNEISHVQRGTDDKNRTTPVAIPDEIWVNNKDLDMVSNLGGTDEMILGNSAVYPNDIGIDYEKNYASINRWEYDSLIQKNKDGDYSYRSITCVSPNGTSMTLIRNNKFGAEDEQRYGELARTFHTDLRIYEANCKSDYNLKEAELKEQGLDEVAIHDQATRYALKQNGTMHDYIKEKGYPERFEDECNTKLRLRGNDINTSKPPKQEKDPLDIKIDLGDWGYDGYPDDAYIDDNGKVVVPNYGNEMFVSDSGYIEDLRGNRYGKYE